LFQGLYNQAQNIGVKYYIFNLYDKDNNLLTTSEKQFNSRLSWEYDGFISGLNYYIELIIENQNSTIISIKSNFNVTYDEPQLLSKPELTILDNKDAIQITWKGTYSIYGNTSGISPYYEFKNNLLYSGDVSNHIFNGNTIYYDKINSLTMELPNNITGYLLVQLSQGFVGDIIKLEDTSTNEFYLVSYDGTKFTYQIGTTIIGECNELNATGESFWWKITLLPTSVQFKRIDFDVLKPNDILYPSDNLIPISKLI
jgi:hypothetical protein